MTPTIATTSNTPAHTPALKISPTKRQLLNESNSAMTEYNSTFFISSLVYSNSFSLIKKKQNHAIESIKYCLIFNFLLYCRSVELTGVFGNIFNILKAAFKWT
jgi:hypothetical protein